jgi:hypothetical protein
LTRLALWLSCAVVGTLLLETEAGKGEGPSSPPLPLPPFFFNSCCSSKLFFRDVVVSPAIGVVSGGGVGVGVDDNVLGIAILLEIFILIYFIYFYFLGNMDCYYFRLFIYR